MRKLWGSVWSDLKKNKFFTILTMLEILVLIIVASALMMSFNLDSTRKKTYKSDYADATVVEINNFDEADFGYITDFAVTSDRTYIVSNLRLNASVVNRNMLKYFKVPYKGNWFSEDKESKKPQALISPRYKAQYKIGEVSTFVNDKGEETEIEIIGYLGKEDLTVNVTMNQYDSFFSPNDMMICDEITMGEIKENMHFNRYTFLTQNYSADYFTQNYDCKAQSIKTAYDFYVQDNFPITYFMTIICAILFAIIIVSVMCNSIFRAEIQIKRNIIKHLSGATPFVTAASEVIKISVVVLLPLVVDIAVAAIMIESSKQQGSFPIITWKSFWLSAFMVLITYFLTIGVGLIRVLSAKILKELKR